MPAKDTFHYIVRSALEKDGWRITHDPLYMRVSPTIGLYLDIGAEKLLAAEREGRKIAVEIKSFLGLSSLSEFHLALGQFLNYRLALEELESDRELYLAVSADAYQEFFSDPFIQKSIVRYQLKLLIFHSQKEVIIEWKT
ncbi:MAG: XisH family protein [Cyanobacteria bacterium SBLK]|nr:XisH family protein [Cyanobacteria bacterium SBLK]